MTIRDLLPFSSSVPVRRGASPITAFQDEVNKLFSDFFGESHLPSWWHRGEPSFSFNPAMDMAENDKEFKITCELPGMDAKDVQINASEGYITIRGEKKEEKKEEKEGYFRQERSYGSFQRVLPLPDIANLDKAEASFAKGVLTLTVPKKAGAQSKERKIEIRQAA